jgi:PAS domain S-box-containing protein
MHIDHQGNQRYFLNNLVGVVEDDKLLRVWTTQNEITQLRMAEKANRYQAKVLENVFDAVVSSDQNLVVKSWNQAAEKLYGIKAADILGHTIQEFIELNYHNTTHNRLLQELYATGAWNGEASFIRPSDGKKIVFWATISLLKNNKGQITDIIAINKDITERKQAEQVIREGEERFRQFADAAPVIIWVADEQDNTIYVNKCFEQFTGLTLRDVESDGWKNICFPADLPIAIEKYKRYFKYREPVVLEYRLKTKDNEYRWVLDHGVPRFLEDGTFVGYIGSIVDIHDRKLAEEKIRFQVQVMQDVSEGIISTDLEFNIISFNKAAENIYGIPALEIVGKRLNDFINLSYLSNTWEEALQQLHEKGSWEAQAYFNRHDGKRIYLNCALSFVKNERGTRIGFAGIYRDITEARQSQEDLRINEERYRSVVDALGEGILMHDKNGVIIACNRSAEMILNVSRNQLIGRSTSGTESTCIYEDGTPFPAEQHPSWITLRTGRSLQNVIMGIQRRDATLVWISINTEPVYYTEQRVHPDAVVSSFVDITQKKAAEIELKRSQQQLREYSERITNILASITDGFIAVDKNLNIFLWNHAVEHITGLDAKHVIGLGVEKIFPNFAGTTEYHQYIEAINKGTSSNFEHFLPAFNRWLETSVYPFSQGAFIYFRDITDRKKQERLLELEKEVLAINAQPAASLKTTIDYFLSGLEKTFPNMICSVIMLNDDRQTIHHLSGPSLPEEYTHAINGIKIGPAVASCGSAIYRKERVITVDVETDVLWDNFRHVAHQFNLRSCWSFPILNAGNDVLATIAVYHRQPATPTEAELSLFERVNSLLRIIIENKNAELKIRLSNERYLLVTKATNDAIWDWDVNTNTLYWGEGIYTLFGFKPGYIDNSDNFWENCIHPDDRDRVVNGLNRFLKDGTSKIWEDEYRFIKPDGEYALVFDRGFLIFDHSGKIARMVGSMQDITDKKELEKKLLKQEVDKQKLIAQAVVNAQEKERAEIGKELHDNVNQILSTAKLYLELAQTDDNSRLELINRSTRNISDAINEIRTISRSLVPPSIGDLGLIDSVQDLVENIKATRKLHVEFYYSGTLDNILDEKRKLMLFRIIQEQVNNVLKHASAKNLVIELIADSEGHAIDLTISDDGKGFELDKVRSKKGVGLSNIASRAQLFNGSVHIVTALGEGCKLKINVPISNI